MPLIGLFHFLIAIGFVIHSQKTGRPQFWLYVLLFVPLAGSLAYVMFELLPELANSRRARKVVGDVRTVVDPDREWRRLNEQFQLTDTIEAKCKLAEECERKGMWSDAIAMYAKSMTGMYAEDADLLKGMARAQLGGGDAKGALATLDKLRQAHPDYQSQAAHMTYARSLEAEGRTQEAMREYQALSGYFVGMEARTRYALLLQKEGQPSQAKALFEDVMRASKARTLVLSDEDRDWIKVAKRNL